MPELPPINDARHSLAVVTNVLQQHIPPGQEAPQTPQNTQETAPQQEETQQPKDSPKEVKDPMKDMELMFTTKLDEIRQELKKDNQREIDTLKQTITDALKEEDTNEQK